jgi:hypothetical protein
MNVTGPSPQTVTVLRVVRSLISGPGRWIQGEVARDAHGNAVLAGAPTATCFCIAGAIIRGHSDPFEQDCAAWVLDRIASARGYEMLVTLNDDPNTTQADIVAWIDEGIASLQTEATA